MSLLKRLLTRDKSNSKANKDKQVADSTDKVTLTKEQEEQIEQLKDDPKFIETLKRQGIDIEDKSSIHQHALLAFCIAGGLIAFSPTASAGWVDSLAKKAAKAIQKAIEPVFKTIMATFGNSILEFLGSSSDKLTSAVGASTDAINTVTSEIENNRIKAAVQPKPSHCRSDELGAESQKADARKAIRQNILSSKFANFAWSTSPDKQIEHLKKISEKYPNDDAAKTLIIDSITTDEGLNTKGDVELAEDVVMNILGPTASIATRNIQVLMQDEENEAAGYELQAKLASKTSRIQVALSPFTSKIAANNNTTGLSRDKIFKEEIDRTYGDNSNEWRAEINSAADPTPVAAELCKLTALSNRIALKQLEALEQGNMILGASLLETIESTKNSDLSSKI